MVRLPAKLKQSIIWLIALSSVCYFIFGLNKYISSQPEEPLSLRDRITFSLDPNATYYLPPGAKIRVPDNFKSDYVLAVWTGSCNSCSSVVEACKDLAETFKGIQAYIVVPNKPKDNAFADFQYVTPIVVDDILPPSLLSPSEGVIVVADSDGNVIRSMRSRSEVYTWFKDLDLPLR